FSPKGLDAGRPVWLWLGGVPDKDYDEDDATLDDPAAMSDGSMVSLCGKCGWLDPKAGSSCSNPECGNSTTVQVTRITGMSELAQCFQCGSRGPRTIRRFESGNDASVSVLTTALYQQLPAAD